jgi:hypothetical protein
MSNRAIRREQLNFDPLYADKQGCINQPLNDIMIADMSVWEFLQEANNLSIEVGGKQAYHYRQELTNKISGNHHYQNLQSNVHQIGAFIVSETLEKALTPALRQDLYDFALIMRDEFAKLGSTTYNLHPNHQNFSQKYRDAYDGMMGLLSDVATSTKTRLNLHGNTIHPRLYEGYLTGGDEALVKNRCFDTPILSFFNMNITAHIPYGSFQSAPYNKVKPADLSFITKSFTDVEIKEILESMLEKQTTLYLEIAALHEFALANPQVNSFGQSWTSRNRSEDCYFKQTFDQVSKKNTFVCALMSDIFPKHTPNFAEVKTAWKPQLDKIVADLKIAEPLLGKAQTQREQNEAQAIINCQVAIVKKINDMLSNGGDEELDALAVICGFAGITGQSMTTNYPVSYYHQGIGQDHTIWVNWNTFSQYGIDLTQIPLNDAQQAIVFTRYQERQTELTQNHAHQCAQLARQIARQTTNHDTQMAALRESFVAYQALV